MMFLVLSVEVRFTQVYPFFRKSVGWEFDAPSHLSRGSGEFHRDL